MVLYFAQRDCNIGQEVMTGIVKKPVTKRKVQSESVIRPVSTRRTPVKSKSEKSPVLGIFKKAFKAALDANNVPPIHYGRQKWIAEKYQVSTSAARKWLSGGCMPDLDNLLMIADDLGVTVDQLLGRKPAQLAKNTVAIPIRGDATDPTSIFGNVEFEGGVLESAMRMSQKGVELFVVSTDAMASFIDVGDIAFIDTGTKRLEDNKVYMFTAIPSNRVLIRRVILNLDDTVRLICTNTNYPEVTLPMKEIQIGQEEKELPPTLLLKGEVTWVIHKVKGNSAPAILLPHK